MQIAAAVWTPRNLAEIDVRIIIGGGFSEEFLGTAYHAIVHRLREHTGAYLDVLEHYVMPRLDDTGLASTYIATLLRLAKLDEPVRVRQIATELRERTALALLRCKRTSNRLQTRYAEFDLISQ
jgi:hypothetical protein